MSEAESYQYIQRTARDNRSSMRDVAEKILAEERKQ
jgi:AmiR/NasT family two-component response regulator